MKQHSFFLCLIMFLPGMSVADTNKGMQSILEEFEEYTDNVSRACDSIVESIKKIDGMLVIQADGIVNDHKTGTATIGCLAFVTGDINRNIGSEFPHDTLRKEMESSTWLEDISRAGDGPSSTTYSLYRDEVMCTISALWGLASKGEEYKASQEQYELEAQCMKRPPNKTL